MKSVPLHHQHAPKSTGPASFLQHQGNMPHEKYYHLFEPLPDSLQVIAFLDRIHAYLPGWGLLKLNCDSYAKDYGFITDYFCEILHELRRIDVLSGIRDRFEIIDTKYTAQGISGRDQRAILKTTSGLLKLLYPDGNVTDDELEEVLLLASELRQHVREQLHLIAPGEYDQVKLGVWLHHSGKKLVPELRDAGRVQAVRLPAKPSVGEVIGLAVAGDHGCILHFEVQVIKGDGKIIPLGSIQRIMRESIEAAVQYVRFKSVELELSQDWYENLDVAVLATYMGVPKEGSSAGITIATGIVSALNKQPVRNDIAMRGEITIMGKVLSVGGIQQKIRAAYDAGVTNLHS